VEELLISVLFDTQQDHYGSASPMVADDDLDVTNPSTSTISGASASARVEALDAVAAAKLRSAAWSQSTSSGGLGMIAKLFYLSIVVAACILFVRSRRNRGAASAWQDSEDKKMSA